MTNISLFLDVFPPPFIGGAEKSSLQILKVLEETGNAVHVHALHSKVKSGYPRLHIHGILNLYNPFKFEQTSKLKRYLWHFFNLFNLIEISRSLLILKRDRTRIVVTQNIDTWSFAPLIAARILRLPSIHFVRDFGAICPTRTMWSKNHNCQVTCKRCVPRLIASRLLLKPNLVIFNSNFTKNHYLNLKLFVTSQKYVLFPLVDSGDVEVLTSTIRKTPKEFTLGFIGRISKEKGIEDFLSVCAHTKTKGIVAGSGEDNYVKLLRSNYPEVIFTGQTNVSEFLNQVSAVIVPSLWNEPFGRIVVESCLGNVPLIVANRGGLKESSELFSHENVVTFYEDNIGLVDQINKMKHSNSRKLPNINSKTNYEKFRQDEIAKLRNLLNEIV